MTSLSDSDSSYQTCCEDHTDALREENEVLRRRVVELEAENKDLKRKIVDLQLESKAMKQVSKEAAPERLHPRRDIRVSIPCYRHQRCGLLKPSGMHRMRYYRST
jgi:predicted RNase H-like nuclease (RuvC/YqgF family)